MDKHNEYGVTKEIEELISKGGEIGLVSEAGLPCIADPGEEIVKYAMDKGYEIRPLVGPSSIMLALMGSGLNGEQFTFHGYLPQDKQKLRQKLVSIEKVAVQTGYSQLWIETPYRNDKVIGAILQTLQNGTILCVAKDILSPNQSIQTLSVSSWKKSREEIGRGPTIFIIGR